MERKITDEDEEINILILLNEYADRHLDFKSSYLDSVDEFFL